ncbi:MAG: signal peptidase II [Eubacteriaceae bacterium]|nr:signal peptidase II [Eubacteriaceae bacterium]
MKERLIAYLIILLLVIISDQSLKRYFLRHYGLNSVMPLKNRRYRICVMKNKGAFLGLGKKYPAVVALITAVLILVLLIYCLVSDEPVIMRCALAALLSAAVSNLIDRIAYKGVIDYLSIRIINRNIVVNLADIIIFASAAIYLISDLFYK